MKKEDIYQYITEFSQTTHGSTSYGKDESYVAVPSKKDFVPFSFLKKKLPQLKDEHSLISLGFLYHSYELLEPPEFATWYEKQFSKKLNAKQAKLVAIYVEPDQKSIFKSLETVDKCYEVLREQAILLNSKNLPVQIGEWYARCLFGLKQIKSSSQRGFDFFIDDKRVEVKVHWSEKTSHKGVRIKKSLARLSDWCIIVYLARNFMIKDICLLDSDFVIRKFAGKGHAIFLKDPDVSTYFFSRSSKHYDKVVNMNLLFQFASPNFALKLDEKLNVGKPGTHSKSSPKIDLPPTIEMVDDDEDDE